HLDVPPDAVALVLADPRSYEALVLGSKRVRWFDARWPEEGTSFRHSIGVGPLHIRDHSTVVADELPDRLQMVVGMGPLGRAEVEFRLTPEASGTRVSMREDPVDGPVAAVWSPPVDAVMRLRNDRALRRLEGLAAEVERVRHLDGPPGAPRGDGRCHRRPRRRADGGAEMTGEETVDADEARELLEVPAEQLDALTDQGVLTPIDDGSGRVRYLRSAVPAARLRGGCGRPAPAPAGARPAGAPPGPTLPRRRDEWPLDPARPRREHGRQGSAVRSSPHPGGTRSTRAPEGGP